MQVNLHLIPLFTSIKYGVLKRDNTKKYIIITLCNKGNNYLRKLKADLNNSCSK